jgi:hypothetical protein
MWSKLNVLGRYSVIAGNIYKAKLNEFVFYNLKPVKLQVAYIAEKNVSEDRTWDKFVNKARY